MLFAINATARPPRMVVFAYDISSPRRARRARRLLESAHLAKQYSVFEIAMGPGEFRGLLAELSEICDFSEDLLAVWWPRGGLRVHWRQGQVMMRAWDGRVLVGMDDIPRGTGDYVICYDIRGRDELLAVHGEIAPYTTMLQRSVYWLRGPATRLACLFARCAPYLAAGSELWAYPLRSAGALWRIGRHETAILPITTHRWREP